MKDQDFNDGVAARMEGTRLQWNHPGMWIEVEDLPTALINELKQQSFYHACIICEEYLKNNGYG